MATIRQEVLLGKKMDDFDLFRDMFNEEIEDKITNGRQGIEQELYLTVRYDASNSYENAKTYFSTLENSMMQSFRGIGSRLTPLDATERLRILHDFYRFGNDFNSDISLSVVIAKHEIRKRKNSGWCSVNRA